MRFADLPWSARDLIMRAGEKHDVPYEVILLPGRRRRQEVRARAEAMNLVANHKINGELAWGLDEVAAMFGVVRNRLHVYRRKGAGYKPRHKRKSS